MSALSYHRDGVRFPVSFDGEEYTCVVTYYDPGTHRPINGASLEPNDPPEFEFRIEDQNEEECYVDVSPQQACALVEKFERLADLEAEDW